MSSSKFQPIVVDSDDDDFVSFTMPSSSPAPQSTVSHTPMSAFRDYLYGFIDRTIEAEKLDLDALRTEFDLKQYDRWYQWWGQKEWKELVDFLLQRTTVADVGLHGCVIYSTSGDTSYRFQTGYGKWMYRQTSFPKLPAKWDHERCPPPEPTGSEQIHRLLAYLCTDNPALRYAIGHLKRPVRGGEEREGSSPLILAHLCNNGDQGCINPKHILYSDALENSSRNGCKNGSRMLCPHSPKCIHVDKRTGQIIPWRNVDEEDIAHITHGGLRSLTYDQWVAEHFSRRREERQPWVLPSPVKKQKRYRDQSTKGRRKKAHRNDVVEELE